MKVKLIAHTKLVDDVFLIDETGNNDWVTPLEKWDCTDGQCVALTAIRTCYSHLNPSEIVEEEGEKYFGSSAKDGEGGTEADRLIRHIMRSGHLSTTEHLNFTFAIEGVSRSLLSQLTRHRHFSYSVQSQRYVKFGSGDKAEGFDYVTPLSLENKVIEDAIYNSDAKVYYETFMEFVQSAYDALRKCGVPAEDARYILPNAATCNLVLTGNLRSLLDFYSKRGEGTHAQWEIQELAEKLKSAVIQVEPWTESFF